MTFEEFVKISETWMKSGRFVWFIHGNMTKENAIEIVEKVRADMKIIPTDKEDLADIRCVSLHSKVSYLLEHPLTDRTNENNCLVTYFEFGLEGMDLKSKMLH